MAIFGMMLRIQPAELLGIRPGQNGLTRGFSIALVPMSVIPTQAKVDAMGSCAKTAPPQAFPVASAKDPPAAKAMLFKVVVVLYKGLCFRHVLKRQIPGPLKDAGICVKGVQAFAVAGFPSSK